MGENKSASLRESRDLVSVQQLKVSMIVKMDGYDQQAKKYWRDVKMMRVIPLYVLALDLCENVCDMSSEPDSEELADYKYKFLSGISTALLWVSESDYEILNAKIAFHSEHRYLESWTLRQLALKVVQHQLHKANRNILEWQKCALWSHLYLTYAIIRYIGEVCPIDSKLSWVNAALTHVQDGLACWQSCSLRTGWESLAEYLVHHTIILSELLDKTEYTQTLHNFQPTNDDDLLNLNSIIGDLFASFEPSHRNKPEFVSKYPDKEYTLPKVDEIHSETPPRKLWWLSDHDYDSSPDLNDQLVVNFMTQLTESCTCTTTDSERNATSEAKESVTTEPKTNKASEHQPNETTEPRSFETKEPNETTSVEPKPSEALEPGLNNVTTKPKEKVSNEPIEPKSHDSFQPISTQATEIKPDASTETRSITPGTSFDNPVITIDMSPFSVEYQCSLKESNGIINPNDLSSMWGEQPHTRAKDPNTIGESNLVRCRIYHARRFIYEATSNTLRFENCRVQLLDEIEVEKKGAFRDVYSMRILHLSSVCAAKRYRSKRDHHPQKYINDIITQSIAVYYAEIFDERIRETHGKLRILKPDHVQVFTDERRTIILDMFNTEQDGTKLHFEKFTNNKTYVNRSINSELVTAFAHFTWEESNTYLMVADFQGFMGKVDDQLYFVLTDPVIHCPSGNRKVFGRTNLKWRGFEFFWMSQHKNCSIVCNELGLSRPR